MRTRKTFVLSLAMSLSLGMAAQEPIRLDLWSGGLPNSNGIELQGYDDSKLNFKPSITVYTLEGAEHPSRCVVICPGGAYHHLAMDHEGHDWVPFFHGQGLAVVVLKYRMPHGHLEVPVSDAVESLRMVHEHAGEWNIDPSGIGIMGFSAGGHLASTVATHRTDSLRPAFQILMYPVISMDAALTHRDTHDNFLGADPGEELEVLYSGERQVTPSTPRAFLGLADDDSGVSPLNSSGYYQALRRAGVPASLHIYPSGGHGYGIRESFPYHSEMLSDMAAWLRSF